jgi:hypothetical protein
MWAQVPLIFISETYIVANLVKMTIVPLRLRKKILLDKLHLARSASVVASVPAK